MPSGSFHHSGCQAWNPQTQKTGTRSFPILVCPVALSCGHETITKVSANTCSGLLELLGH